MLESSNLLIRMKYNIALIEQATLGGTKPHSHKVMMLLVLAFTCNTTLENHNKTLSTASVPALMTPHTSLPYVRMGRATESNK